jgi:hypothetical protein
LQAVTSSKKVQNLPLVISAPLDPAKGTCLVLGVPPASDRSRKNLLGKAFEQASLGVSLYNLLLSAAEPKNTLFTHTPKFGNECKQLREHSHFRA